MVVPVFACYSRDDELALERLASCFSSLPMVKLSYDTQAPGGDRYEKRIRNALNSTKIAVLLVSKKFMKSEYCKHVELPIIARRLRNEYCRVVPVMLDKDVRWRELQLWDGMKLGSLQALPANGRPISEWDHEEHGWLSVELGFRSLILGEAVEGLQAVRDFGELLFDNICNAFKTESWQHYYSDDPEADPGLVGCISMEVSAHSLDLADLEDDYDTVVARARVGYDPETLEINYSTASPAGYLKLAYQFKLALVPGGRIRVVLVHQAPAQVKASPEQTGRDLVQFLVRSFRLLKKKSRR